jgi:hypothetical protein
MLVNSRMEHSMAQALTFGKMEAFMKAILKMVTLMDLVFNATQMEQDMKAIGRMTREMDLDCSLLLQMILAMLSVMKATLRTMKYQEKELTYGRLEKNMLDISKMMSDQVLEHYISLMVEDTKASGKMATSMALEFDTTQMEKDMMEIGRMGKGMDLD